MSHPNTHFCFGFPPVLCALWLPHLLNVQQHRHIPLLKSSRFDNSLFSSSSFAGTHSDAGGCACQRNSIAHGLCEFLWCRNHANTFEIWGWCKRPSPLPFSATAPSLHASSSVLSPGWARSLFACSLKQFCALMRWCCLFNIEKILIDFGTHGLNVLNEQTGYKQMTASPFIVLQILKRPLHYLVNIQWLYLMN